MLPSWAWVWNYLLENGKVTSGYITQEKWLCPPYQLLTANSFSWAPPLSISCRLYAGNLSGCDFLDIMVTPCLEDCVSQHSFPSPSSCNPFCLTFLDIAMFPWRPALNCHLLLHWWAIPLYLIKKHHSSLLRILCTNLLIQQLFFFLNLLLERGRWCTSTTPIPCHLKPFSVSWMNRWVRKYAIMQADWCRTRK